MNISGNESQLQAGSRHCLPKVANQEAKETERPGQHQIGVRLGRRQLHECPLSILAHKDCGGSQKVRGKQEAVPLAL